MTPEERNWALTGYGLYLIAPFTTGLTTLIGVILAHIRKDGARGTYLESHYRNLILVFWVWFAVAAIAAVLVITGLASMLLPLIQSWPANLFALSHTVLLLSLTFLGVVIACLWYYFRLIRGLVQLLDNRPY
ncbi:MAG TPA: hypothetical protein VGI89_00090 [Rhizomicrobium sp.]|jgi:uncharacterized membrane protein